jgi:hypothetical protein
VKELQKNGEKYLNLEIHTRFQFFINLGKALSLERICCAFSKCGEIAAVVILYKNANKKDITPFLYRSVGPFYQKF